MNKILLMLLFCFSIPAYSQTVQPPITAEQKADETVTELKQKLSLTEEQAQKVKAITIDRISKVTEAKKKYGADKQRIQAANKLIFDEWETKLREILTAEQLQKYAEGR